MCLTFGLAVSLVPIGRCVRVCQFVGVTVSSAIVFSVGSMLAPQLAKAFPGHSRDHCHELAVLPPDLSRDDSCDLRVCLRRLFLPSCANHLAQR